MMMKDCELKRDDTLQNGPYKYELFSILIHSGIATGGHYFVFNKDLQSKNWLCFNDESVTRIAPDDIEKSYGGPVVDNLFGVSSTNAYMLMYRQIDSDSSSESFTTSESPEHIMVQPSKKKSSVQPSKEKSSVQPSKEKSSVQPPKEESYKKDFLPVPKHLCGYIIGKDGRTVHFIEETFGTTVKINKERLTADKESVSVEIRGTPEEISKTKEFILKLIVKAKNKKSPLSNVTNQENCCEVLVQNVPENCPCDKLRKMFEEYGKVVKCKVIRKHAFIKFQSNKNAEKAMKEMKGRTFDGHLLHISLANKTDCKREVKLESDYPNPEVTRYSNEVIGIGKDKWSHSNIECSMCFEKMSSREELEKHIINVHKLTPLLCKVCLKNFHYHPQLHVHMLTHLTEDEVLEMFVN